MKYIERTFDGVNERWQTDECPKVTLDDWEMRYTRYVAIERRQQAREKNRQHRVTGQYEQSDLVGARGECAAARELDLYWHPTIGITDRIDVGKIYEVRTPLGPDRMLYGLPGQIVWDRVYLLVVPTSYALRTERTYALVGWLRGFELSEKKYYRRVHPTLPPAQYADQTEVHPVKTLPAPPSKYWQRVPHGAFVI